MQFLEAIVIPFQAGIAAVWVLILFITYSRFRKFREHGLENLTHILRTGIWGELAILSEILRRLIMSLSQDGSLPPEFEVVARSWAGMSPVWLFMAIAGYEAMMLFHKRRCESIAAEHDARMQIGRLATRLHVVSESLEQRNRDMERANLALAAAERKFRDFFENAPLHYQTINQDGTILETNELALRDLGHKKEDLVGQPVTKILHPNTLNQDQLVFQRFWKTGVHAGSEVTFAKKDGTPIPVRLYSTAVRDEEGKIVAARTIWIDISVEKRAQAEVERRTRELRSKNRELEARNHELSEVGHVISHDLKAPLRGIEAFLGFLEEDCGPNLGPAGQSHIATTQESCRRLRRMIDDLIEYAKFGQAGKFEPVALDELLQEVVQGFRLNLQAKKAEIRVAQDLPEIFGDRTQLAVLFRNLIDNALKYGKAELPIVEIGYQGDPNNDRQITITVKDNGIGIPKEHQEKIFGLFQRLHGPGQYEGSGIGLALVKKTVEFHGGQIWVESELGQGSTFFVSLPLPLKTILPYPIVREKSVETKDGNRLIYG